MQRAELPVNVAEIIHAYHFVVVNLLYAVDGSIMKPFLVLSYVTPQLLYMVTIGRLSTSEGASVNLRSTHEYIPVVQLQALQLMFVYLSQ